MIKASEIEERTRVLDTQIIKQGEDHIDDVIEKEWQPGSTILVSFGPQFTTRILAELKTKYETEGGWHVEKGGGDQQDGNYWLKLTKRVPSASCFYER